MNKAADTSTTRVWLRPAISSLLALTDVSFDIAQFKRDPGMIVHLLRFSRPTPLPESFAFHAHLFAQPSFYEAAASLLLADHSEHRPNESALARAHVYARLASELADESNACSADAAWCAGLLLGYFQDEPATARALFARWRMPDWISVAVGYPQLSESDAVRLGGHRGLWQVMKETKTLLEDHAFQTEPVEAQPEVSNEMMVRLLRLAAKANTRSATLLVHELEQRIQVLAELLAEKQLQFDADLQEAKLSALAEFAAGASHEINNPLAVIATNVQLLLSHEDDEERIDRFEAVLRQTRRIHELLHGARQFARPPQPIPALLAVSSWIKAVAKECEPEATEREISLELPPLSTAGRIYADAAQVRSIVGHLVKNSLHAVGQSGWVRVQFETLGHQSRIIVEDSGSGPSPRAAKHMFDPFFSGRDAGRGRGLGLPIAWQLARQNGGELRFERNGDGPTRFVLTLPAWPVEAATGTFRKSA